MYHPAVRGIWLVLIGALLAATTFGGFIDGITNIEHADSTLRRVFIPIQLSYGVASLAALGALLLRWRRSAVALAAWAVTVTAAAGLAPAAWGGAGLGPALSAGAGAAVLSGLVVCGQVRYVRAGGKPSHAEGNPRAVP